VIISIDIVEIHHYFKHDKSTLLDNEYDVNMYAELKKYLATDECNT